MSRSETGRRVGPAENIAKIPEEILTHADLGPAAVRIWAYAWWRLGLPTWVLRKTDIQKRCGVGKVAWATAIKELTRAGLYTLKRYRLDAGSIDDETGKSIGGQTAIEHVFFWPGYKDEETMPTTAPPVPGVRSKSAHPVSGGRLPAIPPAGGHTKNQYQKTKKEEAEASRARGPTATAAAGSQSPRKVVRSSGIWTIEPGDESEAERIESTCTTDEIQAAIKDVRSQLTAAGKARWPTPGPVWDSIVVARRAAREVAGRQALAAAAADKKAKEAELALRASDPRTMQAGKDAIAAISARLGIHHPQHPDS